VALVEAVVGEAREQVEDEIRLRLVEAARDREMRVVALTGRGGGKIVTIGSMTSIFGLGVGPAYASSKGAVVQLTKSLAIAWAKDNIQVNSILPGWIDTDLTRRAREQIPGLHEGVLRRTPAGRWGKIDDFRGIAVFLASRASDFITGATITVDGGYSIQA